jgi:hypothetical protein
MSEPKVMDLTWWITERYAIKERRESGMPPPWTADPVMAGTRFCNVHREDDKVTKWFRKYWNKGDDLTWKFVLGRMINYTDTLEEIVGVEELEEIKRVIKIRRNMNLKVFTSVYTISTCGKSMDKIDYVLDWVVRRMKWDEERFEIKLPHTSLQDTYEKLLCVDGLGSFLTAQALADMKNTQGHPLYDAPDKKTFVVHGPGSIRGLEAFWGIKVTPSTFRQSMLECRKLVDPLIPQGIPEIDNQDFQNCLCEFSKYVKVKTGGHARNQYHAELNFRREHDSHASSQER